MGDHGALRAFGVLLGFVHTACGVTILCLQWFMDDFKSRYQVFDNEMLWVDCNETNNIPNTYDLAVRQKAIDYCDDLPKNTKSMFFATRVYYQIDFAYIIGTIFIWTGLWHLFYVSPCMWSNITEKFLEDKNPWLRWVEYGPSAGAMIFLIAYFIGIEDINILLIISLAMCLAILSIAWCSNTTLAVLINLSIMVFLWIRFGLLFNPTGVNFDDMPWFVTAIIAGEFVMFQSFIIVYVMERKKHWEASSREFLYYLLSATSKLFLGAILTFYIFI